MSRPVAVADLPRYFEEHVQRTETCWLWTGLLVHDGYPRLSLRCTPIVRAHRLAYELFKGPIPDGLTIDHLCRNRRCVNPGHLEAVTVAENTYRGTSPIAQHRLKKHCLRGHPLIPRKSEKGRYCPICRVINAHERKRRKREAWVATLKELTEPRWKKLITYTLPSEGGASLRAAGWKCIGEAGGGSWNRTARPRVEGENQQIKLRWEAA